MVLPFLFVASRLHGNDLAGSGLLRWFLTVSVAIAVTIAVVAVSIPLKLTGLAVQNQAQDFLLRQ